MNVAKQIPGKTFHKPFPESKKESKKYLFYRLNMKKLSDKMYIPQYYGAKIIIDKLGKKKLFQLIKSYKIGMTREYYETRFYKIYGIKYTQFIDEAAKYSVRK